MRTSRKYPFSLTKTSKKKLLHWAQQFNEVVWLDSNNYPQKHETYQAVLAVDAFTALKTDSQFAFKKLNEYQTLTNDWLFGYLSYDLKNDVENLESANFDGLHFPGLYFFQPKRVFLFSKKHVEIQYLNMVSDEMETDWKTINSFQIPEDNYADTAPVQINGRTSKDAYIEKVHQMLEHIKRGDIYEANLCQEFYAEGCQINPLHTFFHLNDISTPAVFGFPKIG